MDNSLQPNSRWYSGSGIYRHVRVVVTEPIHVAPWGVFVSTPEASTASAKVMIKTQVQTRLAEAGEVTIQTVLVGPSGTKSTGPDERCSFSAGRAAEANRRDYACASSSMVAGISRLYRAMTRIVKNGKVIDEVETPFGVRSLAWSVEKGLLLNGAPIKLAGGSVHHDNGPLGAAAFDRAEERRVELLKAAGFNAVRTAHNPPSPAFLDACDRLGCSCWMSHSTSGQRAKRSTTMRAFSTIGGSGISTRWCCGIAIIHRHNVWGIGNEIPEAWTKDGAPIAQKLAARVRRSIQRDR